MPVYVGNAYSESVHGNPGAKIPKGYVSSLENVDIRIKNVVDFAIGISGWYTGTVPPEYVIAGRQTITAYEISLGTQEFNDLFDKLIANAHADDQAREFIILYNEIGVKMNGRTAVQGQQKQADFFNDPHVQSFLDNNPGIRKQFEAAQKQREIPVPSVPVSPPLAKAAQQKIPIEQLKAQAPEIQTEFEKEGPVLGAQKKEAPQESAKLHEYAKTAAATAEGLKNVSKTPPASDLPPLAEKRPTTIEMVNLKTRQPISTNFGLAVMKEFFKRIGDRISSSFASLRQNAQGPTNTTQSTTPSWRTRFTGSSSSTTTSSAPKATTTSTPGAQKSPVEMQELKLKK